MVDCVFWSTTAGVSGAFMGFVFIGLSLCLTNIQTAISKVEAKLAGVDIEELSFASIHD